MKKMTQTTETSPLEKVLRRTMSYMSRLKDVRKGNLYFTEAGLARLAHIEGWLTGLHDAGKIEEAEKLAEDLDQNLNRLTHGEEMEFEVNGDNISVPARKCILHDDGTKHGFSLLWLQVVNPQVYEEHYAEQSELLSENRKQVEALEDKIDNTRNLDDRLELLNQKHKLEIWGSAHDQVVKRLAIRERLDPNYQYSEELTEYRYCNSLQSKVYYRPSYNGGLLYHGPAGGPTFAVTLTPVEGWSIHT
jgi:hypothetical protein